MVAPLLQFIQASVASAFKEGREEPGPSAAAVRLGEIDVESFITAGVFAMKAQK